jgi:hypothetical protein
MNLFTSGAWKTLMLFLIPFGGGIPAGVLLAQKYSLPWPAMMVLYFISDVILACVLEPVIKLVIALGRTRPRLGLVAAAMRESLGQTAALYGSAGGPFTLVMIAFGVEPMTGRAAAAFAGHGFVSGWTLAITGDMLTFTVLMVSTLWLKSVLGDGTRTMIAVFVLMAVVPLLFRRWRERGARESAFSAEK